MGAENTPYPSLRSRTDFARVGIKNVPHGFPAMCWPPFTLSTLPPVPCSIWCLACMSSTRVSGEYVVWVGMVAGHPFTQAQPTHRPRASTGLLPSTLPTKNWPWMLPPLLRFEQGGLRVSNTGGWLAYTVAVRGIIPEAFLFVHPIRFLRTLRVPHSIVVVPTALQGRAAPSSGDTQRATQTPSSKLRPQQTRPRSLGKGSVAPPSPGLHPPM